MNTGKLFAVWLTAVLLASCGSDPELTGSPGAGQATLGQAITIPESPDHRPVCLAVGSRSEGWYWLDSNELVAFGLCQGRSEAECLAIGSRSEGWYCEEDLITWHHCHQAIGVALYGEPCGGDSGLTCYEPFGLYCRQQAYPDPGDQAGVCAYQGFCQVADDCEAQGNQWDRPNCLGRLHCLANRCVWRCDPIMPDF